MVPNFQSYSGISRRKFLGWSAAGVATGLGLHACSSNSSTGTSSESSDATSSPSTASQDFAGQTLRVFIYSGSTETFFRDSFVPAFQAKTGATVIPDPGWWDSIPKLKASPPGQPAFDLVMTDATQGYPAIREGLFQKINLDRIPNKDKFTPSVLDNWVYKEGYGVTFPGSGMVLAYNTELIDFTPANWGDLLQDKVSGKVGLYDSFYMSLYTFACMKVAQEGRPGTAAQEMADNLQGIMEFAKEQRDRVQYWWPTSTDMVLNLDQGNCSIGNMHSNSIIVAMRDNPKLQSVVPPEDIAYVQTMWVIPTDTPNKELAEEAINFLLSEEMQRAAAENGSPTPILSVAKEVAEADAAWKQVYPSTEEAIAKIRYYPYDAYFQDWDTIVSTWDREILRKG